MPRRLTTPMRGRSRNRYRSRRNRGAYALPPAARGHRRGRSRGRYRFPRRGDFRGTSCAVRRAWNPHVRISGSTATLNAPPVARRNPLPRAAQPGGRRRFASRPGRPSDSARTDRSRHRTASGDFRAAQLGERGGTGIEPFPLGEEIPWRAPAAPSPTTSARRNGPRAGKAAGAADGAPPERDAGAERAQEIAPLHEAWLPGTPSSRRISQDWT